MTLITTTECWVHRFIWNKHSCTYTKLSSVLHWQAVMPALAYERQQLEGVSVAVVLTCCGIYLMAVFLCSCCPSLGPSLILFLSPKDDFPQSHMSVISIEHICIISGHSKYAVKSLFCSFVCTKKIELCWLSGILPVIQKSVHSSVKLKMLKNLFFHPFFSYPEQRFYISEN